eukprot:1203738-Lingulodinium_polyedra.AAC.1
MELAPEPPLVLTDSNACRGAVTRIGAGKLRHVETRYLWVQERIRKRELAVGRVSTEDNPADLLTKFVEEEKVKKHLAAMGVRHARGLIAAVLFGQRVRGAKGAESDVKYQAEVWSIDIPMLVVTVLS